MSFIKTSIGLLINTKQQFEIIKRERKSYIALVKDFLIYIILINSFIDITKILLFGPYNGRSIGSSILFAVIFDFMLIIFVYISGVIIDFVAPRFKCKKDRINGLQLATYCSINTIIGSLISFIPLNYIGLLSLIILIYIRYFGLIILYNSQKNTFLYALFPEILVLIPSVLLIAIGFFIQSIFVI